MVLLSSRCPELLLALLVEFSVSLSDLSPAHLLGLTLFEATDPD
jgi:hypothetical protein